MPASLAAVFAIIFSQSAAAGISATVTVDYTATRPMDIYECTVRPIATANVSGAVTMSRQALGSGSFNNFTNGMTATTSGTVARTTTITTAEATISPTDVIRYSMVDGGGSGGANARAYLRVICTAITGQ